VVSVSDVGMMRRFFMAPALMVLRRFFVVSGRIFMMLRRFQMMFCTFLAHKVGIGGFLLDGFLRMIESQTQSGGTAPALQVTIS
jgi:hypothetical protein